MRLGKAGGRSVVASALVSAVVLLSSCTADPPPPIQSTETPEATPAPAVATGNPVVVAIDDVGTGFNPHLVADQSQANVAVGSLVLPSPFRPAVSVTGGTEWVADPSLVLSAEVTNQSPFTIVYQLRNESQWSDGAPIAAEDFRYLWQQMISAPGVVDPAGYALVDDVQSSGGGKTVTVTMSAAYPAWRELFADLLPSHLVKDSPGGFEQGLRDNVPVSGGQFRIKSIDKGRDEILLERNDRFWGAPATPDQILLRRGGTSSQLADSMRSGDAQIAQVRGGTATRAQLAAIPGVRTDTRFQPRALGFVMNSRVPELADADIRRGMLGLLDPQLLSTVAAGSGSADEQVKAQILAPSQPGYAPTAPAPIGRDRALELLATAGYVAGGAAAPTATPTPTSTPEEPAATTPVPAQAGLGRGGVPLALVIGAPEDDDVAVAVANTAADELRAVGVDATVTPLDPEELYGSALTSGAVGAVVGWTRVGTDPVTALAARFGCPTAASTDIGNDKSRPDPVALSNLSGVCDPAMQPEIDAALRGTADPTRTVAAAEARLWSLAAVLPIIQDTSIVAVGPGVTGASLTGPIESGVFGDAAGWTRQTS